MRAVGEEPYGDGLEGAAIAVAMARVKAKPDGPQPGSHRFSRKTQSTLPKAI